MELELVRTIFPTSVDVGPVHVYWLCEELFVAPEFMKHIFEFILVTFHVLYALVLHTARLVNLLWGVSFSP